MQVLLENPKLVLNVLRRDFPNVLEQIETKIKTIIPDVTLSDFGDIRWIVDDYCLAKGVSLKAWMNVPGFKRITHHREVLVALIIKFYQPERLAGIEGSFNKGFLLSLSRHLNCTYAVVRYSLAAALSNYNIYPAFRKEVDDLYENFKDNFNGNPN
ncbi:hypothetical protein [Parapedobacter indicus]|uniref:Uncharacterized protein n=1 Tax=Parapedobacter indicus TaxID=1477437 RepID=A0A1I3V194_9SPHI|nr:hypothetical protein [Parapedobacter indicus]PPK99005.1 hypothetical protein CLV26_11535 [Parapedobacter indicus]SFJ88882.1 hypothetical protein SAMN05444682_115142 [Parapedobacter indicus]